MVKQHNDHGVAIACWRARTSAWYLAVIWLMVVAASGCESLQGFLDSPSTPSAKVTGVRFQGLDAQTLTLGFDVRISNPYSFALPLVDVEYALASRGQAFLSGQADLGRSIPANSSGQVSIPATVRFKELLEVIQGVKPGAVVPYDADLQLSADAPGLGPMQIPVGTEGELPIPTVPGMSIGRVHWQDLSFKRATAVVEMNITNHNAFPLTVAGMDYGLSLAGVKVVHTKSNRPISFKPGEGQPLRVPITVSPANLGLAFFNLIKGEGSDYQLAGTMDLDTPYGTLRLPIQSQGQAPFTH